MKALVLEQYNQLVFKDVPDPEIQKDEVLVQVKACGICGSDVHGLDGSTGRRIPPIIMGHEASGIIVKIGKNVANWEPGNRVTFDSTVYPVDDWFTLQGRYNLSDNREVIGVSPGSYKRNGAFAEYIAVPQHILYKIPDKVSFEEAAMVEPAAVALHAINLAQLQPSDKVAVVGTGMIGLFLVKLLKLRELVPVIAVDINKINRDKALKMGATHSFDPYDDKIISQVNSLTEGRGPDIVFEAVGINDSVQTAIDLVRKGGRVILVGNVSPTVEVPLQKLVTGELLIQGSCAINGEYESVLNLIDQRKLNVKDNLSAVAPLSEGASWFYKLRNKEEDLGKVILVP